MCAFEVDHRATVDLPSSSCVPRWQHGPEPPGEGSDMALPDGYGLLFHDFSVFLPSESRCEEASGRQQPAAAAVSDAARQEDPSERGERPKLSWLNRRRYASSTN